MIILLYGPDSYRRQRRLHELVIAYRTRHTETDYSEVNLSDEPEAWQKAKDFLNQPSMFVDSKILIVKEGSAVQEKEWLKAVKAESATEKVFIVLSEEKRPPKAFAFLLQKPVRSEEFGELIGRKLQAFIHKEIASRRLVLGPQAEQFFVDYIALQSERSWRVVKELDKIALAGFVEPVALVDLQRSLPIPAGNFSFEKAQAVIAERSVGRRLFALESLFLSKAEPAYLFNLLAYQVRGRDAEKLTDLDVSIKSGGLTYEEALLSLIVG